MKPYPLEWPLGYPQTKYPKRNHSFRTTFARARDFALAEIKRLGGKEVIISTDIPVKQDGMPYADATRRTMKSQGVAVYFKYNGESVVFCCDKWNDVEHNMHAVAKSIEAIRGLDRWGVSEMLKRVFTGFEALPEAQENWWTVLYCQPDSDPEFVKNAYRHLIKKYHPDSTSGCGNRDQFERVQNAYEKYKTEVLKQ